MSELHGTGIRYWYMVYTRIPRRYGTGARMGGARRVHAVTSASDAMDLE